MITERHFPVPLTPRFILERLHELEKATAIAYLDSLTSPPSGRWGGEVKKIDAAIAGGHHFRLVMEKVDDGVHATIEVEAATPVPVPTEPSGDECPPRGRRLSKHEQDDLLNVMEAGVGKLQGRPLVDYIRDHFLAEACPPRVSRLEWLRRTSTDSDPEWSISLENLVLCVAVGGPWAWTWHVENAGGIEMACGDLYIDHPDSDEDAWDYQGLDVAQIRCEAVAHALHSSGQTDSESGEEPKAPACPSCGSRAFVGEHHRGGWFCDPCGVLFHPETSHKEIKAIVDRSLNSTDPT